MALRETLTAGWETPNWLTKALWPLSQVYRGAYELNRLSYQVGLRAVYRPPVPLIVVGNLTVGGTGKTPLVVHIVQLLKAQGLRVGIISRGYHSRATDFPLLVDDTTDVRLAGDEPSLLARRTGVPIVIGPNRRADIERLVANGDLDVIVSDDGLQHHALARDVDVCLIDQTRPSHNTYLLPAGPYRESPARQAHLDFLIHHIGPNSKTSGFTMQLVPDMLTAVASSNTAVPPSSGRIHAVAGIGNPQRFFRTCEQLGFTVIPHAFPDHYQFTAADIDFGADAVVLMTEKDAVKCDKIADHRHWYVPVSAQLSSGFDHALLDRLSCINNS
ncbi:tetraacyldisaccharide 4'-kinase [Arenicella chitinivorans]|uniref:Tetraacyldisaccharide 4'-kinase n=1 Tax=Arenicella chitinivorans TaxID=1329800 RepID=A0A918VQG1_9GAMM|nr:tetraacyldisaccharide 4'-kinase [Arenicella chitinivorans]GHA15543.1 tetraacyldisaccharide 4'-kinase [Arenicella chitinivorans]